MSCRKRTFLWPILVFFAAVAPAVAQDAPIAVFFPFSAGGADDDGPEAALHAALKSPDFLVLKKPDAQTLVLSLPNRARWGKGNSSFDFTLAFSRNRDPLGQSEESCPIRLSDGCIQQIIEDIRSAAAMKP